MNNNLSLLNDLVKKHQLHLEKESSAIPLVSINDISVTRNNSLILKISKKQAASISVRNKFYKIYLNIKIAHDKSEFIVTRNSVIKVLIGKPRFIFHHATSQSKLFLRLEKELQSYAWKRVREVRISKTMEKLEIEFKSGDEETTEEILKFLIDLVDEILSS